MPANYGHIAGGDINPARFVKVSTLANKTLLQAGSNDAVLGISQEGQRDAPVTGASDLAAAADEQISINPVYGEPCLLEIGSGGCTAGDELIADANGKGVVRATTGTTIQNVGAIALESASAGEFALVQPVRYPLRPALS